MLQGGTGHDGDGALPGESLEDVVKDHGAASLECRYLLVWRHFTRPITPPSKPWVVERTFAWIGRYRRHSRDYEWYPESSESMIRIGSIHRMLRLLKPDRSGKRAPFNYPKVQE